MNKHRPITETLLAQIKMTGLPEPVKEYPFTHQIVGSGPGIRMRLQEAGLKNWRFDLAWPEIQFAVECEGGTFTGGAHVRGAYYRDNMIKYNTALLEGWQVYRCDMWMVKKGIVICDIEKMLTIPLQK